MQSDGLRVLLTPRESEVAQLLCDGLKLKEIAGELGISINTVKKYVAEIYDGLGITERAELVTWCYQHPGAVLSREWAAVTIQRFGCRPFAPQQTPASVAA